MVCWTIPLMAAVITYGITRGRGLRDSRGWWLNLMFLGGALFGVIDHLWYGELFLISEYWLMDAALGSVIAGGTFGCWGVIVFIPGITRSIRHRLGILESHAKT